MKPRTHGTTSHRARAGCVCRWCRPFRYPPDFGGGGQREAIGDPCDYTENQNPDFNWIDDSDCPHLRAADIGDGEVAKCRLHAISETSQDETMINPYSQLSPPQGSTWLTNCHHTVVQETLRNNANAYRAARVKPTDAMTAEQLTSRGMVGIYTAGDSERLR